RLRNGVTSAVVVGRLPTNTNPAFKTPKAVVRPSGGVPPKNKDAGPPLCLICTIVVPVPWRPELLLKFETRMSPARSGPQGEGRGPRKRLHKGFRRRCRNWWKPRGSGIRAEE